MPALTRQLGAFHASPSSQAQAAYQAKPLQANTRALFAEYTRQRQHGAEAQKRAREASARDREDISAVFAKHRAQVKRYGLTRTGKRGRRLELQLLRTQRLAEAAKLLRATEEDIDKRFFSPGSPFSGPRGAGRSGGASRAQIERQARGPRGGRLRHRPGLGLGADGHP